MSSSELERSSSSTASIASYHVVCESPALLRSLRRRLPVHALLSTLRGRRCSFGQAGINKARFQVCNCLCKPPKCLRVSVFKIKLFQGQRDDSAVKKMCTVLGEFQSSVFTHARQFTASCNSSCRGICRSLSSGLRQYLHSCAHITSPHTHNLRIKYTSFKMHAVQALYQGATHTTLLALLIFKKRSC